MADAQKPADKISGNMTGGACRCAPDETHARPPGWRVGRRVRCVAAHPHARTHAPTRPAALCVYSCLFMRFAWAVQARAADTHASLCRSVMRYPRTAAANSPRRIAQPRNYLLFACHASNECVQARALRPRRSLAKPDAPFCSCAAVQLPALVQVVARAARAAAAGQGKQLRRLLRTRMNCTVIK
jgi:hypothetical protein